MCLRICELIFCSSGLCDGRLDPGETKGPGSPEVGSGAPASGRSPALAPGRCWVFRSFLVTSEWGKVAAAPPVVGVGLPAVQGTGAWRMGALGTSVSAVIVMDFELLASIHGSDVSNNTTYRQPMTIL